MYITNGLSNDIPHFFRKCENIKIKFRLNTIMRGMSLCARVYIIGYK